MLFNSLTWLLWVERILLECFNEEQNKKNKCFLFAVVNLDNDNDKEEKVSNHSSRHSSRRASQASRSSSEGRSAEKAFPEDFKLISADMSEEFQKEIVDVVLKSYEDSDNEKEQAKYIKQKLDEKFGRLWHVVHVVGQYWNFVSHEPKYSFNFRLGRDIFLLWRTPGY